MLPLEDSEAALEAQLNAIAELAALGLAPADSIARVIAARSWDEPWSAEYIDGLRNDLSIASSTDLGSRASGPRHGDPRPGPQPR